MSDLAIIDYGLGNLGSVVRMIEKTGGSPKIIKNIDELTSCEKILLVGVGHFGQGMKILIKDGWNIAIKDAGLKGIPILGICLGMQLLCKHSEEGDVEGLGLVDANVKKFEFHNQPSLKVPHMGWNTLCTARLNPLLPMDEEERRFYFVHSYKVVPNNPDISIGQCDYGGEFCAAFQQGNVFGVQFHPEKSHRFGMALMKRFVEL